MLAWEATTFDRMTRPCSMIAAPVSSHELSIARMRASVGDVSGAIGGLARERRALGLQAPHEPFAQFGVTRAIVFAGDVLSGHHVSVFVVVTVVARAHARLREAVLAVQALRYDIRDAHFE